MCAISKASHQFVDFWSNTDAHTGGNTLYSVEVTSKRQNIYSFSSHMLSKLF